MGAITKRCNPAAMGADFQWSANPSRRADRTRSRCQNRHAAMGIQAVLIFRARLADQSFL